MQYRVRLLTLALVSFVLFFLGSFLSPSAFLNRLLAIALSSLLSFQSNAGLVQLPRVSEQVAAAFSTPKTEKTKDNLILARKRCVFGVCVGVPDPVDGVIGDPAQTAINGVVKQQLRQILRSEIPIVGTEQKLLPKVKELPGVPFHPQTLDIQALRGDQVIPPGDYEIPVHMYCTKVHTLNGAGNQYIFAKLNGRMAPALSALYERASRAGTQTEQIQVLSWSIQIGVPYKNLPEESKRLVNQLIPEYIPQMQEGLAERITSQWNKVSSTTRGTLPSFESTLNQLGAPGNFASTLLQARNEIVQERFNYQPLRRAFVTEQDVSIGGRSDTTPWTKIPEKLYLRVIAPQGAMNNATVQVRILEPGSKTKALSSSNKEIRSFQGEQLALLDLSSATITPAAVAELLSKLTAGTATVAEAEVAISTAVLAPEAVITAIFLAYLLTEVVAIPVAAGHQAGTFTFSPVQRKPGARPIPVPITRDEPSRRQLNRGRIQAQGSAPKVEKSQPWAQDTPLTAVEGQALLDILWNSLTRKEKEDRIDAYGKAKRFIENALISGGVDAPVSKTFQNRQRRDPSARIDIEVIEGKAFVP